MNKFEKAIAKEKKFEFVLCIFFLIPPILGLISFILCFVFDEFNKFSRMSNLRGDWTDGENCSSLAPIYLGLMAIAGAYMVKDSFRYFFLNNEDSQTPKQGDQNSQAQ